MHARRFMGFQIVYFVKIFVSEPSALGLRCSKRSHLFLPVAPRRFGCWARGYGAWADRPRLFSPSLFRARAHDYLYPSPGARDNSLLRARWYTANSSLRLRGFRACFRGCSSRLAARRRGLPRPTLSTWTCFRAPLRSSLWIGPMSPASLETRVETRRAVPYQPKFHTWKEEAAVLQWSASRDLQILEAAFFLPPYQRGSRWLHQPCGFCGAGLHRHSCGRGYSSLPSFALFGAFLEVSSPPSN